MSFCCFLCSGMVCPRGSASPRSGRVLLGSKCILALVFGPPFYKNNNNDLKANCRLTSLSRSPTWHDDCCLFQGEICSCPARFQLNLKEKDAPWCIWSLEKVTKTWVRWCVNFKSRISYFHMYVSFNFEHVCTLKQGSTSIMSSNLGAPTWWIKLWCRWIFSNFVEMMIFLIPRLHREDDFYRQVINQNKYWWYWTQMTSTSRLVWNSKFIRMHPKK